MIEFFFCAYEYPEFALWPSGKKSRTTWIYERPYGVFTKIYGCHLVIKLLNLFIPSKVFLRKTVCIVFLKVHVGHSSKRYDHERQTWPCRLLRNENGWVCLKE